MAAYMVPADAWHLIPVDKLASKGVYLSPLDDSSVGRYETWRDAWNVFAWFAASTQSGLLRQTAATRHRSTPETESQPTPRIDP